MGGADNLEEAQQGLRKSGITIVRPGRGSHFKLVRGDGKTYPIPAGRAEKTEIPDCYIKALCRTFDFDETRLRAGRDARPYADTDVDADNDEDDEQQDRLELN